MSEIKFGTGGFRGIIGDTFTKSNIQKICQAIANIVNREKLKKRICIGYDNRFMSEDFAKYCAEVFLANDFIVILFKNATSTPVSMYKTMIDDNDYGVMITASHNPYIYNGIKVFTKQGKDASLEDTKKIENEFNALKEVLSVEMNCYSGNNLQILDCVDDFVNYIINNQKIQEFKDLRVVFDNKFGSSAEELKLLCEKLNIKDYKIIHKFRDAFFNFTLPAPSANNIEELKQEVLNNKYNIGFALDADGDRLAVVDENGNYLDNNIILALVYYYFVKYENKTGGVVKNNATSVLLDILADKLNSKCYEVPVGFKYISSKLIETKAVVGGESSGGLAVQNHIWGKDSLLSIAICIKIMEKLKKPFSQIVNEMLIFADNFKKIIQDKQFKYSLDEEKVIKDIIFNKKALPNLIFKPVKVVLDDYLKIYYENNNWTLVRFSGTEPVLRLFVEFDNKEECEQEFKLWQDFLHLED